MVKLPILFRGGFKSSYGDGGHGNGDNVTAYKMNNFVLTPGAGGEYYSYDDDNYFGGGGGGVLVNGEGPQKDYYAQGEGYGGGGCKLLTGGQDDGLPGVILMEVEEN